MVGSTAGESNYLGQLGHLERDILSYISDSRLSYMHQRRYPRHLDYPKRVNVKNKLIYNIKF
jgi:hypothetical protein